MPKGFEDRGALVHGMDAAALTLPLPGRLLLTPCSSPFQLADPLLLAFDLAILLAELGNYVTHGFTSGCGGLEMPILGPSKLSQSLG
jgi:hypothetical protein